MELFKVDTEPFKVDTEPFKVDMERFRVDKKSLKVDTERLTVDTEQFPATHPPRKTRAARPEDGPVAPSPIPLRAIAPLRGLRVKTPSSAKLR